MSSRISTISHTITSALISALVIYVTISYHASATTPDFAFPTKVSAQSLVTLQQAVKQGDDPAAIRALIDYTLARNAVSSDNPSQSIAFIDSVGETLNGTAKIMTDLLAMRVYADVYNSSRWTYDNRTLPLTPLPANCLEWSGSQFRHQLLTLGEKVLASSADLTKVPLKNYAKVITSNRLTYIYYPTLWDFAASQIIRTLTPLVSSSNDSLYTLVSDTYTALINADGQRTAPLIKASLGRIRFIGDYTDDDSRAQQMEELYNRYSSSEYSGEVLVALSHMIDGTPQGNRHLYSLINEFLKAHPAYHDNNALRNRLHELTRPHAQVRVPSSCAPDRQLKVDLNVANASSVSLAVYEITSPTIITDSWINLARQHSKLLRRVTQRFDTKVPFDTTVTINLPSLPHTGYYAVVPELPGATGQEGNQSVPLIRCTRTALGYFSMPSTSISPVAVGIDPLTGNPIAEGELNLINSGKNPGTYTNILRLTPVGKTDTNGFLPLATDRNIQKNNRSGEYLLTSGTDHYGTPLWINPRMDESFSTDNSDGRIFTSLSIVHPGDTVGVAAVAYTYGPEGRRVMAHTPMKIVLRDVNGNSVDTLRATTDAFGRIHGRFDIPQGSLTGNYRLILSHDDSKKGFTITSTTLMVSDYKLPTFKVEIDKVLQGTPAKGDITLTGRVMTYSGFGLGDATADMRLTVNRSFWWWRSGAEHAVAVMPVTLNADGSFTITVDAATLSRAPYREGSYTAEITAVSPTGETRSAQKRFAIGEAYTIRARIPSTIEASSPVRLDVDVINAEDTPVDATLRYFLINASADTIAHGTFSTSNPVVDLSQVTPATYSIILQPQGEIADACTEETTGRVAIYRRGVNVSPSPDMLWMADRNFTASPGEDVQLTFGMPETEVEGNTAPYHVLYMLSANDSLIEYRWIEARPGFNTLSIRMPQTLSAHVMLCATSNYVNARADVTLTSPALHRSLRVERESFRDNLLPGTPEKWTLRILDVTPGTDDDSTSVVKAAVMARMYNHALDALSASSPWQLSPRSYTSSVPTWRTPAIGGTLYPSVYGKISYLRTSSLVVPDFNTYGRALYRHHFSNYLYGARSRGMKAAATVNAPMTEEAVDDAEEGEVVLEEVISVKAESKMAMADMATSQITGDTGASVTETEEESAEEENGNAQNNDDFDYRDSEVPLAFFKPTLSSDNGTVTVEFTTPNANATWCFDLMAWTEEMITGSMSADIVSSKPVMVQPNLPRFLRTGDHAILKALVMNNTTDSCEANTIIELFDPVTSKPIGSTVNHIATLAPNGTSTVQITVDVPYGISMLGYRVRSTANNFTDGEQTVLPVLPSSQAIIETQPFYIAPSEDDFTMKLPDIDKKSSKEVKVTLQYCNDPAWYIITALPGIASEQPSTATDAAVALMSATVARGIVVKYPAIADALHQWQESDRSDSTLVSMLERNQDLKTVLLQETPWMSQARSDTERMAQLVFLTDRKRCDEAIRTCIDLLDKLYTSSGGWSWSASFDRPSLWVTYSVLERIGRIKELGFMPDDKRLAKMVNGALDYCDREAVKAFSKNPDGDFTTFVALRDLFPEHTLSNDVRKITNRTVQTIISRWRNYDIASKASAALILNRHGYSSTAREVTASILDYAVTTPQGAKWWPSATGGAMSQLACAAKVLDALSALNPHSPDIDSIRQWLVLQKEARDWGTGTLATNVIASFLASTPSDSSSWLKSDSEARITIGRRQVKFTPEDKILEYMRTDISSLHPSGATLKIRRSNGHCPSWGAVIEQYQASMDSITPEACEAVSITKRITPINQNNTIHPGDKLRVQLVINVNEPIDYVAITDERAACLEPVDQLPGYIYSEGLGFYRENRDTSTRIFIDRLPRGVYILSYDMYAAQAGRFASGVATLQSQYAPSLSAHSGSAHITVEP